MQLIISSGVSGKTSILFEPISIKSLWFLSVDITNKPPFLSNWWTLLIAFCLSFICIKVSDEYSSVSAILIQDKFNLFILFQLSFAINWVNYTPHKSVNWLRLFFHRFQWDFRTYHKLRIHPQVRWFCFYRQGYNTLLFSFRF